jgi:beta-lactamase class A
MRIRMLALALAFLLQPSTPLAEQFTSLAKSSGGHTGVAVRVIESGESAGLNDTERFPMQSVYKLPIAMAILDRVAHKTLTLDQKVHLTESDMPPSAIHSPIRDAHVHGGIDLSLQDLIHAAIVESDGAASDVLLRIAGGGARVTAYLRGIGVRDMAVVTTEVEMSRDPMAQFRNYSTPAAAVALLTALQSARGVAPATRDRLVQYMIDSTPGPQRLKGRLPANTVVAHKTGTDGTRNGVTAATNDVGIITLPNGRHLAIAVFVNNSNAELTAREGAIANISRAAYDRWSAR